MLITVDTLRHDAPGFAGGGAKTPFVDRLARGGRVFPHAFAHNVVTLPSHANILTGLYPYQHGVRDNAGFKLGEDVPTLATLLQEAGYATAAFVAAFPLDARFGLDRGFDRYDDRYHVGPKPHELAVEARRGDLVVAPALAWWESHRGERRFLWLHLYDPHAPYDPPPPFAEDFAGDPYLGEVSAVDAYLEPVLAPLLEGAEPPALVVFTADHGEALGDHDEATHGLFAYDATLRVPLVLWGPGIVPGVDERTVGHVDLLPTLIELLGLPEIGGLPGRSLLSAEGPEHDLYFEALSAYFNRGWAPLHGLVRGSFKYIELPLPELYDLRRDAQESDNLVDVQRPLVRALHEALPAAARDLDAARSIGEAEARELRSLGYLATSAPGKAHFTTEDDPKRLVALDRMIHQMAELASAGETRKAEEIGRELIVRRPDMSLAYLRLAALLKQDDRLGEAVGVLQAALARGIDPPAVVRDLGLTLAEAGRPEGAIELLLPLAAGGDLDTLNALGVAYFTAGRLDEGREVLTAALAQDPDNLRALETLGAVLLAGGDAEAAARRLRQALEINPALPIAWNTLGVARKWQGDVDGALEAWERAVALDPAQLDTWYNLGRVATEEGRIELARRAFEGYLARAPAERFPEEVETARRVLAGIAATANRGQ